MKYAFELGHQPHVSIAEIISVFKRLSIPYREARATDSFFIIEVDHTLDAQALIHILGGTIRIAYCIEKQSTDLLTIAHHLEHATDGKIQFSISGVNQKSLALEVKKHLKSIGRSVRYIESKNAATVIHNNLIEKKGDIIKVEHEWYVTCGIQDIESFTHRDYERPRTDSRSGMLPPKLARIMVNLSEAPLHSHLLDPFCGSGTVLIEALSLGYTHVSGSDNSEKAVEDSIENTRWFLKDHSHAKVETRVHLASAEKLENVFKKHSVDVIVSEPYMGKPLRGHESKFVLETQALELKMLYLNSFESFKNILSPTGVIIFIIPIFKSGKEWVKTNAHIEIEKLGFNIIPFSEKHTSLLYSRDNQFVGREIWKFKKA
ncbi:MAG TPA: RsmD family RNA methyltransferase [Candidatus Magasanikbacteria bacterium]|nr:RsmD family RNA methyltransferase [Candidatus Magasanikbacteria bacterium]